MSLGASEPPVGLAAVTRLWTGKGDDGTSGLLYGGRALKSSSRFEALGQVDEAQAFIGVARAEVPAGSELDDLLIGLERDLWVLMAEVATDAANQPKLVEGTSKVSAEMVVGLEAIASDISSRFVLPTEFVVPGQDRVSALLDAARTVVRRAERASVAVVEHNSQIIPYLNRLSSVLWTLARWVEGAPQLARRD